MKKLFLFILLSSYIIAKQTIIVSIVPEQTFLKEIVKDKFNIEVMVKPGNSPHTYEPKPSQMKSISKAKLYLSIGVEFENSWLNKFHNQNKSLKIINIEKGIKKINNDPHIWTNPIFVKIISKNILDAVINIDKTNKDFYTTNYNHFIKKLDNLDEQIKQMLSHLPKQSKFLVVHPSWGYFAKEYGLIQLSIEIDGKSPKPKEIIKLIKEAKKENVRVIFTSPEFSTKIAKQIAHQLNIKVIKVSPLASNYISNILKITKAIAQQ